MDAVILLILILISISDVSSSSFVGGGEGAAFQSHALPVQRKFKGVSTEHDRRRHLASAVDLPLGHNRRATGLYYTQVKIGSPAHDYYPIVDSGSDLFWIKCNQNGLYYPSKSRTASDISCDHDLCSPGSCERGPQCSYQMSYGDKSSSEGFLVSDRVQLDLASGNSTVSLINSSIILGCGVHQSGRLADPGRGSDGIVGFGRSKLSLVSQLADLGIIQRSFAHCLAAEVDGGIFVIGRVEHPKVKKTPLMKNSPRYIVNMLAIEIGKHTLRLGTTRGIETAIDCGSTLSYLPGEIYEVIVTKILSNHRDLKLFMVDDLHCFNYNGSVDIGFPTVTLHFEDSLELVVYPRDYLIYDQVSQYCLGWRNSGVLTKGLKRMAFLGDNVLSHKFVLYDIEHEGIGWTPYDCSSSVGVKDGNSTTVHEVGPRQVFAPFRQTSTARSKDMRSVMIFFARLLSLVLSLKFSI